MTDETNKFWRKYEKADTLKREKMILGTILIPRIIEIVEKIRLEEDVKRHCMMTLLKGYFDDIISYKTIGGRKP